MSARTIGLSVSTVDGKVRLVMPASKVGGTMRALTGRTRRYWPRSLRWLAPRDHLSGVASLLNLPGLPPAHDPRRFDPDSDLRVLRDDFIVAAGDFWNVWDDALRTLHEYTGESRGPSPTGMSVTRSDE